MQSIDTVKHHVSYKSGHKCGLYIANKNFLRFDLVTYLLI